MNLTPSERAAMVKDLESLAVNYWSRGNQAAQFGLTGQETFNDSMASNYSALAAALKEGLTFNEVV